MTLRPGPDGLVEHPEPAPYPFGPYTVADILNAGLEEHPDRLALVDGDRQWTWHQLEHAVIAAAANITEGQLVHWTEPNSAELVVALLATFRAGGIWMSSPNPGPESVDAGPRIARLSVHRSVRDPFSVALVSFTSGTTGRAKAVAHSEHGLLAPGLVSIEVEPPAPGERIGTPLDLRIANVAVLGPISALLRGSTFVVMNRRFAVGLAEDIDLFGVTRLFAVPTMVFDLAYSSEVGDSSCNSLDRVVLGGSGSDPEPLREFEKRFGVRPTMSYGLSETPTGVVRESLDDPIGSGRGFPLPHIEVVIVDPETGGELSVGDEGEVCIRAASSGAWANCWTGTLGYLGEPDRTAALFQGGLLHTGDRGRLDLDGALSVTGRLNDLIIRGGKNIDPRAIEAAAIASPAVSAAGVVGIADDRLGQIVGLALVLESGHDLDSLDPDFLDAHDLDSLDPDFLDAAEIAMETGEGAGSPIDAVVILDELPRNVMGKVDRVALVSLFGPETRLG